MSEKEIEKKLEAQETKTDHGTVKTRMIENEMEESYLDYAMSVIVARALPDVRDGLKPVHRKILYAMNEMGLSSGAKFRKSATVVGEVMGKFHPHGDTAIYDTLARMAQDFSMRYMLIHGQGNFGSIDGDMPAAMRYTECKMKKITEEMLADIDKETVDFMDNFDASRKEPVVLPSKVPNLLINGAMGIAVGMATDIPPHNLGEVCDATIALIENPKATIEDLLIHIKGPDFPTGGEIYGIEEIKNAYSTGKGRIVMRSVCEIEEGKRNAFRIRVSEIPYRVNKATLIEKIAQLAKDKKVVGITDIRDESDKDGIRVIIELKKDAYPQKILNQLYKFTQLQETFHANMLALVDGIKPQVLNLKTFLEEFIKHRQVVVFKRTEFELRQARARLHVLEGLKIALDNIDAVIETIKKSANRSDAEKNLINKFKLSKIQANAILDMRLSALAKLERDRIEKEYKELLELIKKLDAILADPKKILKIIKDELIYIKEKFADPRRTKLYKRAIDDISQEDLIPNERVLINLTKGNYIKRIPISTYRSQARGGKGVIGITTKEEDRVVQMLSANNHDNVLFFTNLGRVFMNKAYDIMQGSRQAKGQAIVNLLQIGKDEKVTSMVNITENEHNKYLLMATTNGVIKKSALKDFKNVRKSGLIAIKLKNDYLNWVKPTTGDDQVMIVTNNGQAIRFRETDIRAMGRSASGVRGIRLRPNDSVVSMEVLYKSILDSKSVTTDLLVVTEKGMGKRSMISNYHIQMRGGIGLRTARITEKTGSIVEARVIQNQESDLLIISEKGQVIRMPMKDVRVLGRSTSGVRVMRLNSGDKVASISVIEKEEVEVDDKSDIKDQKHKLNVKDNKPIVSSRSRETSANSKNKKTNIKNKTIAKASKPKKAVAKNIVRAKTKPRSKTKNLAKRSAPVISSQRREISSKISRSNKKPKSPKSDIVSPKGVAISSDSKKISGFKKRSISSLMKTSSKPIFIKKAISDDNDKKQSPKSDDTNYWGSDFWKKKKL